VYEAGGVAMPPNSPAAEGQEAIRAWLAELFADGPVPFEGQLVGFETAGDRVISHGTYTMTFYLDEESVTDTGKWVDIARRQPDGSFRTVRNIWNSDLPVVTD
jgi:ketosteroid isomerase-like protein